MAATSPRQPPPLTDTRGTVATPPWWADGWQRATQPLSRQPMLFSALLAAVALALLLPMTDRIRFREQATAVVLSSRAAARASVDDTGGRGNDGGSVRGGAAHVGYAPALVHGAASVADAGGAVAGGEGASDSNANDNGFARAGGGDAVDGDTDSGAGSTLAEGSDPLPETSGVEAGSTGVGDGWTDGGDSSGSGAVADVSVGEGVTWDRASLMALLPELPSPVWAVANSQSRGWFQYTRCWNVTMNKVRTCEPVQVNAGLPAKRRIGELVLAASFPRSGSTWLYRSLEQVPAR